VSKGAAGPTERGFIGVGLLGMGVVGTGVAEALSIHGSFLQESVGLPLKLQGILVRDAGRSRSALVDSSLITTQSKDVLENPEVDIVIELMGGEDAALPAIRGTLADGRSVVTGNKEVMAKHGAGLLAMARAKGASLKFEAAVGGAIPVISALERGVTGARVRALRAIINGTTNYILTRMAVEGMAFEDALSDAQAQGYAEADPGNDINGTDAAYKLAVLATLAYGSPVSPESIYCEGIGHLTPRDFRYAHDLGYAIKLLAIAKEIGDGELDVRVHPAFIASDAQLAKVDGVYNAVQFDSDSAGELLLYGRGAGSGPTTSAVLSDLIEVARRLTGHGGPQSRQTPGTGSRVRPIDELDFRYYLRLTVSDQPGVLAAIARILGDASISIASVIQQEVDETAGSAEIVITTHRARESALRDATGKLTALDVVREIGSIIRVEE